MWQRYTNSTASFISGYRVVCSHSPTFTSSNIINCHSGSTSASDSSLTLSNLDPSTPLYVRVQVVRTINGHEAVDELSSPTSALICPGKIAAGTQGNLRILFKNEVTLSEWRRVFHYLSFYRKTTADSKPDIHWGEAIGWRKTAMGCGETSR